MNTAELHPYIRFMDQRIIRYAYTAPVLAYEYRLFFQCSGQAEFLLNGQSFSFPAGSCAIFRGGIPYRFTFSPQEQAEQYVINFDLNQDYCDKPVCPPAPALLFDESRLAVPPANSPFSEPILVHDSGTIEEYLKKIQAEFDSLQHYHKELASALMNCLLFHALRLQEGLEQPLREPVFSLVNYLNEHFCSPITGALLSKQFAYHSYYLEKCFRQQMGVSIHQYLLSLRLKKAAQLLISSDSSVEKIAEICCFSSAAHLAAKFKRLYGITPTRYRKATHSA